MLIVAQYKTRQELSILVWEILLFQPVSKTELCMFRYDPNNWLVPSIRSDSDFAMMMDLQMGNLQRFVDTTNKMYSKSGYVIAINSLPKLPTKLETFL